MVIKMALTPINEIHEKQIEAGTVGRKKGHKFEAILSGELNQLSGKTYMPTTSYGYIFTGNPAENLLQYIANNIGKAITIIAASWLGGLATSGQGDAILDKDGKPITGSKSDVLLKIKTPEEMKTIGVSVKTCNKKTPTNDQMFFTTAHAFCQLLRRNNIDVSVEAEKGMSMFCGDIGYRPLDIMDSAILKNRISDPHRYYWEETSKQSQKDWENIFKNHQDAITMLLFQKAYKEDPFPPDYLLHQTVKYELFSNCETAIFSMKEIVELSRKYSGYVLSEYSIHKGTYKNDNSIHLAPRFGFIQFQRGGQKQHPTQLQFNLKAGYFRHI